MSWIKAYSYRSPEFVLEQLLKQVRLDIEEANALPESARDNTTFSLEEGGGKSAAVNMSHPLGPAAVVHFNIMQGTDIVRVRRDEGRSHSTTYDLRAQWEENSQIEVWTVNQGEMVVSSGVAVEDVTRMILEPAIFTTPQ